MTRFLIVAMIAAAGAACPRRGLRRVVGPGVLMLLIAASACSWEEITSYPCPSGSTLTYDNFGKDFMTTYCVRCHGGPNGYSSRAFTDVDLIRANAADIFRNAAADNVTMPPGPDDPPKDQRDKLAEWLACGAP